MAISRSSPSIPAPLAVLIVVACVLAANLASGLFRADSPAHLAPAELGGDRTAIVVEGAAGPDTDAEEPADRGGTDGLANGHDGRGGPVG